MGFTEETFAYLADLERNNSKDWFEANRTRYDAHWKTAGLDFVAELSERMAKLEPSLRAEARLNGSLRRINRDVRFSKDKSPYNARLHLVFWAGNHPNRSPGLHLVLQPDGVGYGAGQWGIDPARLGVLRQRIIDEEEGETLQKALGAAATVDCTMGAPDLARVPKGFSVDNERSGFLRYKGFVARTKDTLADRSVLLDAGAADWVMMVGAALMPLIRWLSR
ncbi:MAG: DUF2461 domain-containing protein [Pseudomonadota bacterium]